MSEFAASEWQRAQGALDAAHVLIDVDPNSAASRAYYAAFHAVSALFAVRGEAFSKHSAVRAAVHRDLVHVEGWPAEFGQDYDFLFLLDLRSAGDYGGSEQVTGEDARAAVDTARRVFDTLKRAAPELGDTTA
ncbi:MAG: HEPN domain-containing protein [Planctomycetota bacterium]